MRIQARNGRKTGGALFTAFRDVAAPGGSR
jgi:hypothetical protein